MENENFKSKDFYLSAVCLASQCSLTHLNKTKIGYIEFVFSDTSTKCNQIISNYWANKLLLNPRKLIDAINQLKTRIHQGI